ncbi:hypothetical protein [Streptomyces violaceusniger]|uniref:Uncharacterized protein n=1 Tax=Streptomyces violaceusniger (strain Tu 4113) TaxID=653045 RepID=G2PDA2_STRV4|nr:hypothetical protein [Streptomyces violaceusniger]AEM81060.1 hypothetical protein Strvi_1310 [Streptomyces violaceusniger Tu 4113]
MSAMAGLRLLPWTDPNGKPCYLASDGANSPLSRRADTIEAVQVSMGAELLRHARPLLDDPKADVRELRFLANRLCEALRDVLRVAESRGARLPSYDEGDGPDVGTAPASAAGSW